MNSGQEKRFNYILIFSFFLGILINAVIVMYSFDRYSNFKADNHKGKLAHAMQRQCSTGFSSLGMSSQPEGLDLLVTRKGLEKYELDLAKISFAIQECPGYRMNYFCMGVGCEEDIVLRLGNDLK